MLETRLLRRVIHYIWECFRTQGEMKIPLKNHIGDELHVEELAEAMQVVVRYFAQEPSGEFTKQIEVLCYIARNGEWLPLELYLAGGLYLVYATVQGENPHLEVLDPQGQAHAAGFCDQLAMALLEAGFLAHAAKLNPLGKRAAVRPH